MDHAALLRLDTGKYKRILAVSDIHGRGWLLESLLAQAGFCDDDMLLLLGDYIEKGEKSLETLRLVMKLCKADNVFALQGNCDTLWDDLASGLYCVDVNTYIDWRVNSVLSDMSNELGLDRRALGSQRVGEALYAAYEAKEFAFLRELPQLIETEGFIFTHGGLDEGPADRQMANRCLKRDTFLEEELHFEKTVVCGHVPVTNYCAMTGDIMSYMPLELPDKNIVCIDGGNAVKNSGQLNLAVFERGRLTDCFYTDELPEYTVKEHQAASRSPASVVWNHRWVERVEKRGDRSLCKVLYTGKLIEIPECKLTEKDGKLYSWDYTDYEPELQEGEKVKLIERDGARALIKARGVIGWAEYANLTLT